MDTQFGPVPLHDIITSEQLLKSTFYKQTNDDKCAKIMTMLACMKKFFSEPTLVYDFSV